MRSLELINKIVTLEACPISSHNSPSFNAFIASGCYHEINQDLFLNKEKLRREMQSHKQKKREREREGGREKKRKRD